jgi:hypothetical protein
MEKGADSHTDGGMKSLSETLAKNIAPTDRILFLEPYKVRLSFHLIPYYLRRMRPDWHAHGVINKMTLCADAKAFRDAAAKQPRDGFWVVSFDDNNKDAALNSAIKKSGARLVGQYPGSSLWRIGCDQKRSASLPAKSLLAQAPPAIEMPKEGSVMGASTYGVALPENDEKALKTPTILFPVVRDENGQPLLHPALPPATEAGRRRQQPHPNLPRDVVRKGERHRFDVRRRHHGHPGVRDHLCAGRVFAQVIERRQDRLWHPRRHRRVLRREGDASGRV